MSDFLQDLKKMCPTAEAARLIREVAEPRPVGDSVKAAIRRAARRVGCSFNRARDLWYGDERIRVHADEIDTLRAKARANKTGDINSELDVTELRMQLVALAERVARLDVGSPAQAPQALYPPATQTGHDSN